MNDGKANNTFRGLPIREGRHFHSRPHPHPLQSHHYLVVTCLL